MDITTFDPGTASSSTIIAAQKQLRLLGVYNGNLDADWGDWCKAGVYIYGLLSASNGTGYMHGFIHRAPVLVIPGDGDGGFTEILWPGTGNVDGDGPNGNPEHDECWQPTTTGKINGHSIDSRKVRGLVVPPEVRRLPHGTVIGCQGWIKSIETGKEVDVISYDAGGEADDGEMSWLATKSFGVPSNPISGGVQRPIFLYRVRPGVPGQQNGITYPLIPI